MVGIILMTEALNRIVSIIILLQSMTQIQKCFIFVNMIHNKNLHGSFIELSSFEWGD